MYNLSRRHEKACRYRHLGVRHIKCNCPLGIDGYDEHGKRIRISLKTRSWTLAQARLMELERDPSAAVKVAPAPSRGLKLEEAIKSYLNNCTVRNVQPSTVTNANGTTQPITPATHAKEVQTLRSFFRFCIARKWISENPAGVLEAPIVDRVPTLPSTEEEIAQTLGRHFRCPRGVG